VTYQLFSSDKKAQQANLILVDTGSAGEMRKSMSAKIRTNKDNHYFIYRGSKLMSSTMSGGANPHVWFGFERKKVDGRSFGGRKQAGLRK